MRLLVSDPICEKAEKDRYPCEGAVSVTTAPTKNVSGLKEQSIQESCPQDYEDPFLCIMGSQQDCKLKFI